MAILVTIHVIGGGTFEAVSLGAAALITALVTSGAALSKAGKAQKSADANESNINGGLTSLTQQILHDEIRVSGLEVGLANRVAVLETEKEKWDASLDELRTQKDDCLEREARSSAMFKAIHDRLDESGLGRNGTR